MPVNRNTAWRNMGAVPYETWNRLITQAGGTEAIRTREVWQAYGQDSALALAMLKAESSYASDYDKIPESYRNALNLQIQGTGVRFKSYVEAANAWRERLHSLTYGNGVYARTKSIKDLISTYAPSSDGNNTEAYITGVVSHINKYGFDEPSAPEEPIPMPKYTYGRVPYPKFADYEVPAAKKFAGQVPAGSRRIRAFVRHTAYGNLVGTTSWFMAGNALTEFMIGNAYDGNAALDGQIRRFNDPKGSYYPHASGPVEQPIGDAAKFLQLWPGRINIDTVACERSGNGNTPVSTKERASRVALIAHYADQYGKYLNEQTGKDLFTCDTFPFIPTELNRSFLIDHEEIYVGKRGSCPGPQMDADINREIADVVAVLKRYQLEDGGTTPPPEPEYAHPQPPAPGTSVVNGRTFLAVTEKYTLTNDAQPRLYADPNSAPTGPILKKGTEVEVSHVVSDVGESADMTLVLKDGSRIPAAAVV